MKKRWCSFFMISVLLLMLCACANQSEETEVQEDTATETQGGEQMQTMTIEVQGQQFKVSLYDNETVDALVGQLPMTLSMTDLNSNEKYYYLDESLPTQTENISQIQAGDVMLYGSSCLVLFYETFNTSYSYTRIGHVEDASAFTRALGRGDVEVTFRLGE